MIPSMLCRLGLKGVAIFVVVEGLTEFVTRLYHLAPRVAIVGLKDWWYLFWSPAPGLITIAAGLCLFWYAGWIVNRVLAPFGRAVLSVEMSWQIGTARRVLLVLSVALFGAAIGACGNSYLFLTHVEWDDGRNAFGFVWGKGYVWISGMQRSDTIARRIRTTWQSPQFEIQSEYRPGWRSPWEFWGDYDLTAPVRSFWVGLPL